MAFSSKVEEENFFLQSSISAPSCSTHLLIGLRNFQVMMPSHIDGATSTTGNMYALSVLFNYHSFGT